MKILSRLANLFSSQYEVSYEAYAGTYLLTSYSKDQVMLEILNSQICGGKRLFAEYNISPQMIFEALLKSMHIKEVQTKLGLYYFLAENFNEEIFKYKVSRAVD